MEEVRATGAGVVEVSVLAAIELSKANRLLAVDEQRSVRHTRNEGMTER